MIIFVVSQSGTTTPWWGTLKPWLRASLPQGVAMGSLQQIWINFRSTSAPTVLVVGFALPSSGRSLVCCPVRSAFSSLRSSVAAPFLRAEAYLSNLPATSCRTWACFLLDSLRSSISWSKSRVLVLYSAANALKAFNRSQFGTLEASSWTVRSPFSSIAT